MYQNCNYWYENLLSGTDVMNYDHNCLRFLTIVGEKMAFFSKTIVMVIFFAKFFSENI
jgi:hypothetical protein